MQVHIKYKYNIKYRKVNKKPGILKGCLAQLTENNTLSVNFHFEPGVSPGT